MSADSTTQTSQTPAQPKSAALRRRKKAEGRKKKAVKLKSDREFAKVYFEAKSKRSAEKKSTFRKKKNKKK